MSQVADKHAGWTLAELVVVIAVLAIVAALAAPRSPDRDLFAARGYAVELAAAARLSRAIATASACPVRLQISSAGYLALQPAMLGTHCAPASGGFVSAVARASGGQIQGVAPAGLPPVGVLQWTFNTDGTVQVVGGAVAAVGLQSIAVDPATGAVTGP